MNIPLTVVGFSTLDLSNTSLQIVAKDGAQLQSPLNPLAFVCSDSDYQIETDWITGKKQITVGKETTEPKTLTVTDGFNTWVEPSYIFIGGHPVHRPPTK